jgi:hypothetical protein
VPNERKRKGREQRYNMGTRKISFVAVWYRGKSSQGSGPGVPSPKQAQIEAMLRSAHRETYRKKRGGIIRSEKCLNSGHFLTYNDQIPKAPFPPKQLCNFPTPWGFIPVNPTAMDGRELSYFTSSTTAKHGSNQRVFGMAQIPRKMMMWHTNFVIL